MIQNFIGLRAAFDALSAALLVHCGQNAKVVCKAHGVKIQLDEPLWQRNAQSEIIYRSKENATIRVRNGEMLPIIIKEFHIFHELGHYFLFEKGINHGSLVIVNSRWGAFEGLCDAFAVGMIIGKHSGDIIHDPFWLLIHHMADKPLSYKRTTLMVSRTFRWYAESLPTSEKAKSLLQLAAYLHDLAYDNT
jgi:hypothetical protein